MKDLVYSTAQPGQRLEDKAPDLEVVEVNPGEVTLKLQLEKKGRGGKQVSCISGLPHNPDYAARLLKELKNHLGTGGAFKDGVFELQGNHLTKLKPFLQERGFSVKGG